MAVIVAFGNSNTWGYDPEQRDRASRRTSAGPASCSASSARASRHRGRPQRPHHGFRRPDRTGSARRGLSAAMPEEPCAARPAHHRARLQRHEEALFGLARRHRQRRGAPDPHRARRSGRTRRRAAGDSSRRAAADGEADGFRRDVRRREREVARPRPALSRRRRAQRRSASSTRARSSPARTSTAFISRPTPTPSSAMRWPKPRGWSSVDASATAARVDAPRKP